MSVLTPESPTAPRPPRLGAGPWLRLARRLSGARGGLVSGARTPTGAPTGVAPSRRPRVTVVVPCFDYARHLPVAVGSALDQQDVDVDVVVVDDASTDDSLAVARRLAAADPRVTVVARPVNGGPVATFNEGLRHVRGEYLVRLDADDALTPGSLARATALADAFPEVGLVYGSPRHFSGDRLPPARTRVRSWTVWSGPEWLDLRCRTGVNCITSPEVLMRTSVVEQVGGQRDLDHTHDMEMWYRLARAADVGRVDGPDQAFHREHPASRSARDVDVLTDLRERADAMTVLFTDGLGDPLQDARLLAVARAALAEEAVARVAQAVTRGWGGDATTDAYLAFAASQVDDPAALPSARRLAVALRVGPRRARFVPTLLLPAVGHRLATEARRLLWRRTGL
ncbi:glycosyltransferase family 2 protein [Goekera deserti]|uniref:glycosyltransferase family 2 protein n=1 Tax=Goekera deserti TaxID=2497753 RepID=UPI00192E9056|nr:glycosyltransferase family 2 protein [Goekera deserti]